MTAPSSTTFLLRSQDYLEKGSGPSCIATERPSNKGARQTRKIEDSKPQRLTEKTDQNQEENCSERFHWSAIIHALTNSAQLILLSTRGLDLISGALPPLSRMPRHSA